VNSGYKTHPVGQKKPNALGLYDMHGNALEWCRDWYDAHYYANGKEVDPENTAKAAYRVLRSSKFSDGSGDCYTAKRWMRKPSLRGETITFRVVVLSGSKG